MKVEFLSELLYQYDCVIVPGFGGFISSYSPAKIDRVSNRFFPPSNKLAFNASLTNNDGLLANYVSGNTGTSFREANEDIRQWVERSMQQLQAGNELYLSNIGRLKLTAGGNVQFEPEDKINYFGNSFGLPSFIAQQVPRAIEPGQQIPLPRVQSGSSKLRYLIPETLKWAAVLAPFIAFAFWGAMNNEKLGNYIHNSSGLYSWVKTTPGKNVTVRPKIIQAPALQVVAKSTISPASIITESDPSFSPAIISYNHIREIVHPVTEPAGGSSVSPASVLSYHIIGGAFREPDNAKKLVSELILKGYPANIIDTTKKGMFIVSIQGFSSREEALHTLASIHEEGYGEAWIMRKN